jgi:glutathione S-transferase
MRSPVILWQMPAMWGLPNPSPFCMKVETWLRMNAIPYETRAITGMPRSRTAKVPYVERPGGHLLEDSSLIIQTLTAEYGSALDTDLDAAERATAHLVQRTLEESLYFAVLWERWVDPAGWRITKPAYFASFPWLVRRFGTPFVRYRIVAASRAQGIGRMLPERIRERGIADVRALAEVLGQRKYVLGKPSTVDATAYAFLANLLLAPYASPIRQAVLSLPRLVSYVERMKERYY